MFTPTIYYYKLKKKFRLFNEKDNIKYHTSILKYLDKKYGHIISNWEWNTEQHELKDVWSLWLQGEDNAPNLVKKCFESMRENLPQDMTLHILDENNLSEYIEFPEYIIEKYRKGFITKTHFSDLVRAKLLSTYGGLWIDSTVYVNSSISKKELNQLIFTINEYDGSLMGRYISESRWTGYLIGGTDTNCFQLLDQLHMNYWKEHNKMVDYFLIDYFIRLIYEKNDIIRQYINNVEVKKPSILELQVLLSEDNNETAILDILNSSSHHFNKLSYKRKMNINYL